MTAFLTDTEFTDLEPIMEEGWDTLREWYGNMTVAIARQGGTSVGTFSVISIKLANRQPGVSGFGEPLMTTEQTGLLRLYADAVSAAPVRRGDRFLWGNQACIINTPPVVKRGNVAEYGFTVEARNP